MIKVRAHSNIALIKYWGKRSQTLKTPQNGSISLTLDKLYTETTVTYSENLSQDQLFLNGEAANAAMTKRVASFMNLIRTTINDDRYATIDSHNFFPTGAGLASSASAFAALTLAATLSSKLPTETLSRLARQGSGSACRSIYGGFAEWKMGSREDGADSYAVSLNSDWQPTMLVLVLTATHKKIGSGDGMQRTVDTSPLYQGWLDSINEDLDDMRRGIAHQDFEKVGALMEHNALKMHATALASQPSVLYWEPASLALIQHVQHLRQSGVPCFLTMDAGPNVKVLLPPKATPAEIQKVVDHPGVKKFFICKPGPAAHVVS